MTEQTFPPDPPNGMIYELTPGVYYQYDKSMHSWVKLNGFYVSVDLATPYKDGLMSKEDYKKINGLLIPPPNTTLTSEDCSITFEKGVFGFRSTNDDMVIEYELPLVKTNENGIKELTSEVYHIHENTYGLNFRVNMLQLVETLTKNGQLTYRKQVGPQGYRGLKGLAGRDRLNTGPVGEAGTNGINAPWPGTLSQDQSGTPSDTSRGIVDVSVEKISEDENYILAVRGNIVNANYCPQYIKPTSLKSKWVVVVDDRQESIQQRECDVSEQCGFKCTGIRTLIIPFCTTKLYYLDITDIEESAKSWYEHLLNKMKTEKEALAKEWLETLKSVFASQKLALCCALTNCNTRKENQKVRETIGAQRIQAAQAGLQLVLGGRDGTKLYNLNQGKICQYPPVESSGDPPPLTDTDPDLNKICPALAILNIDSKVNYNNITPVTVDMDAGSYMIEITNCCAIDYNSNAWGGLLYITYNGPSGPVTKKVADLGKFTNENDAISAYVGASMLFDHIGGEIKIWSAMGDKCCVSGYIQVVFRDASCVQGSAGGVGVECATEPAFSTDVTGWSISSPMDADVYSCDINLEQINWYEAGWRTGACCGALVQAGGYLWIVTKRSIADNVICGGGESLNTPCIKGAYELGFHPSFAFQTVDGQVFIGKPTSLQRVFRDLDLEGEIMAKIRNGQAFEIKGDPLHNFEGILFPFTI